MIRGLVGALSVLALVYPGLVITSRLVEAGSGKAPAALAWLDPFADLRAEKAELEAGFAAEPPQPASPARLRQVAFGAPLDPTPYLSGLIAAARAGETRDMDRLSAHVIDLDPRSRAARFARAQVALTENRYTEAALALARLVELDPQRSGEYITALGALAQDREGRRAVQALLKAQPAWGGRLVAALASQIEDTQFVLDLVSDYPSAQGSFVSGLARRGAWDKAFLAFMSFLSPEDLESLASPYDGRFEGRTGAQPFNWSINRSFASFEPRGGLNVSFFGKGRPMIAEQVLALSPGPYEAAFAMRGEMHPNGGTLEWTLACLDAREPLMRVGVNELHSSDTVLLARADIPEAACAFQRLRLSGVAGEFPRTARADISSVAVQPRKAS